VTNLHDKLINIEDAPAFDHSCHPRCSSDRADHPIATKLLYQPHYKLSDVDFDQSIVNQELNNLENNTWNGYNNDVKGIRGAGISTYWSAKFFRNFTDDEDFGFGETLDFMELLGKQHLIKNGRIPPEHLVDTPLCQKIPYIKSIVEKLVTWNMCDRIMISKIDRNQRINWHSHNYYEKKYTHAYVHIPLQTDHNATMLVYMDGKLHEQHYGLNEAWIINTQHNHAVNNKNGNVRYHILALVNFEDPKLGILLDK
jgi:hypothetical protein